MTVGARNVCFFIGISTYISVQCYFCVMFAAKVYPFKMLHDPDETLLSLC